MRRKEKEISDRADIETLLAGAQVGTLGLNGAEGPYAVPVNYGYDGENGRIYIHCARSGRKLDHIAADPRVCFTVIADYQPLEAETACKYGSGYRSAMVFGHASVITEGDELITGLDVLMAHHNGPSGSYDPKQLEKVALIRIDIETVSGKQAAY